MWERCETAGGENFVPGCITHASVIVEHPELVAERIVRLARIVGRERVMYGEFESGRLTLTSASARSRELKSSGRNSPASRPAHGSRARNCGDNAAGGPALRAAIFQMRVPHLHRPSSLPPRKCRPGRVRGNWVAVVAAGKDLSVCLVPSCPDCPSRSGSQPAGTVSSCSAKAEIHLASTLTPEEVANPAGR